MSDQQSSPQEGPGSRRKPWTYGRPWTYHPGYWGPTEPWKAPYYEPYGPQWGPPPRVPPPNYNYQYYQGNQAQSASHGKPQTQIAPKSSAQSGPKKRKVAEVALVSQPKAGSAKTSSRPIKSGKQNPPPQAVQVQAAKRMESFAKLNRKAQLYQAAMERFRRSLVYHNRRFSENIQETDLVNLDDQSEEVELSVALKRKQRNRERLNKRKAKSLAEKGSKPAEEPEATLDQTAARNSQSSTVVVSTPVSLDTDVEMTPVVALPEGELKEGQIYHLVNGKLVVYDQAHLSTDQATSGSPPETTSVLNLEQPKSYAEITGQELSAGPTSTGLEESLAKLTTSSSEISQGQAVSETRKETGGQLAAGTSRLIPGLVLDPPKETPAEKRKRKRLAAKAAKAAKPIEAAGAPTSTEGAKVVLTISGPPKNLGAIPKKKSSAAGRQKTPQVGQGPNREAKGPGGRKIP